MGIFEELIKEKCKYCACQGSKCSVENCDNFAVVALREAEAKAKAAIEKLYFHIPSDPEYQMSEEEYYTNQTLNKLEKDLFGGNQ